MEEVVGHTRPNSTGLTRRQFLRRAAGVAAAVSASASTVARHHATRPRVLGTNFVNVKGFGAVGDGVTDDTVAIRRAAAAACATSGSTLYLPKGRYRMDQWQHPTMMWSLLGVAANGLTIAGDGPGQTVIAVSAAPPPNALAVAVLIHGGEMGWHNRGTFDGGLPGWLPSLPVQPFVTASVPKGATSVTLKSAAGYAPGDWVFIRTGQTIASGNLYQPDAEINRVTGVSGSTVNLAWPLKTTYKQERFLTATNSLDISSLTGAGALAPYGMSRATGRVCQDVTLRDVSFDAPVGVYLALAMQAVNVRFENLSGRTGLCGVGGQYVRTMAQRNINVQRVTGTSPLVGSVAGYATGSVDVSCDTIKGWGDYPMNFHVHEGVAKGRFSNVSLDYPASTAPRDTGISFHARAYDCNLTGATVAAGSASPPLVVDEYCTAGGVLSDIKLTTRGASTSSGSVRGQGWTVQRVTGNKPVYVGAGNSRI